MFIEPVSTIAIIAAVAGLGKFLQPLYELLHGYFQRLSAPKLRISMGGSSIEITGKRPSEDELKRLVTFLKEADSKEAAGEKTKDASTN